jgi:diaminopimelate decarboxylase
MKQRFEDFLFDQKTPAIGYDLGRLRADAAVLKRLCDSVDGICCYAVKANRHPRILEEFAAAGFGADVASGQELALAHAARLSPLVATAPGLDARTIRRIDRLGGTIYFDHLTQVGDAAAAGIDLGRHGIRVSIPGAYSAFGFTAGPELERLRTRFDFRPRRIHVHCGENISRASLAARLADLEPRVRALGASHVNLGGGYGVLSNDWDELSAAFRLLGSFAKRLRLSLTFEFGKVAMARSGALVATVIGSKPRGRGQVLVIDASSYNLGTWESHALMQRRLPGRKRVPTTIIGQTCYEEDIFLARRMCPRFKVGEKLAFTTFGAYATSIGASLHGMPPPRERFFDPQT